MSLMSVESWKQCLLDAKQWLQSLIFRLKYMRTWRTPENTCINLTVKLFPFHTFLLKNRKRRRQKQKQSLQPYPGSAGLSFQSLCCYKVKRHRALLSTILHPGNSWARARSFLPRIALDTGSKLSNQTEPSDVYEKWNTRKAFWYLGFIDPKKPLLGWRTIAFLFLSLGRTTPKCSFQSPVSTISNPDLETSNGKLQTGSSPTVFPDNPTGNTSYMNLWGEGCQIR